VWLVGARTTNSLEMEEGVESITLPGGERYKYGVTGFLTCHRVPNL
jgi:hypothetical protein